MTVKEDIQDYLELLLKTYPGQQLMEGDIKYVRAAAVRLILLAKDYAPKEDGDVLRRKMMMEILLKALPKDTAKYVREKEPGDVFATMDLASRHMAREGLHLGRK